MRRTRKRLFFGDVDGVTEVADLYEAIGLGGGRDGAGETWWFLDGHTAEEATVELWKIIGGTHRDMPGILVYHHLIACGLDDSLERQKELML